MSPKLLKRAFAMTDSHSPSLENEAELTREDFSAIYDQYAPDLLKYLLASGMNVDDAQDTVHNSFLVLWELRDKISGVESLKPLWFTIARHKMADSFRKKSRMRALPSDIDCIPDPNAASPPGQHDNLYLRRRIANALEQLPDQLADCYKLVKISGLSIRETAELLALTESAVKSQIFRARKKLMTALADLEDFF